MKSFTPSRAPCPIGRASRILGDRWAMLILREAFLGVERFDQFLVRLAISRASLTSRLALLVEAGVLERVPPEGKRANYRLTDRGKALAPTYEALRSWGETWLFTEATEGAPSGKTRIDQLLVDRGLVESRTRAQAMVMAGLVFAGERKIEKPGQAVADDVMLDVRGRDHPWVSRGGIKLAHGLDVLGWDVNGAVAIDVGSSTGGFTDVLLSRGAARVYAVDSGTNQLAWKLRQDARVIVHEQTSARILTAVHIPEPVDLVVCDASFIGLAKVLEVPLGFAKPAARLMALIKPQFEAGRGEIGKGGVVRDAAVHARVCDEVAAWLVGQGWAVLRIVQSPITGPEGNIEFLIAAERRAA